VVARARPQVAADDRGSGGDSRYFILAGFKASIPIWAAFADQWAAVLHENPPVEYFKMSEAESRRGQFDGFDPTERDKKVSDLISVIEQHELWAGCCAVDGAAYEEIVAGHMPPRYDSPYLFAFAKLLTICSGQEQYYGASCASEIWMPPAKPSTYTTVDFVFDRQPGKETEARRLYDRLIEVEPYTKMIGSLDYRNDKEFLPLQAADLAAWQHRRLLCESHREGVRPEYVRLHGNRLRSYKVVLGRSELLGMAQSIRVKAEARRQGA